MKITTFLLLIIAVMQISTLLNSTVLDGQWNGILLWLHTALFLIAIAMFASASKKTKLKEDRT